MFTVLHFKNKKPYTSETQRNVFESVVF